MTRRRTSASGAAGAEEEIAKILNETDVYIKYNLHAKAIEHLQRAFERNPRHVGAREKLKALYLILGKKDEAVLELWSLVEHSEPGRKRRYLREILEIDPRNARAAGELGEKLPAEQDEATAGIDEFDSMPHSVGRDDVGGGRDSGPLDLLPRDSVSRDPEGTGSEMLDVDDLEELSDDEFDVAEPSLQGNEGILEDDLIPSTHDRRRRNSDLAPPPEEDDELIPVVVEPSRVREFDEPASGGSASKIASASTTSRRRRASRIASGSTTPAGRDWDRHRSRRRTQIDARRRGGARANRRAIRCAAASRTKTSTTCTRASTIRRHEFVQRRCSSAARRDRRGRPAAGGRAAGGQGHGDDARARGRCSTTTTTTIAAPSNKPITRTVQTPAALLQAEESGPSSVAGGSLEDDLDEADFFTQQSLFEEARAILETLLARHPSHPLVTAKLRDLEAMEQAAALGRRAVAAARGRAPGMTRRHERASCRPTCPATSTPAPTSAADPAGTFEMTRKGVIEKGVTAEDFETHYDLGIAYKEMGLLDDAINEFRIVMKDPAREVQCHLMIGLCFLEKGMQTDAIGQFKKGLYVEGITEREALSMYFELGQAYERLNDPREALYYYEKVMKRDPNFRDVQSRVGAVRGGGAGAGRDARDARRRRRRRVRHAARQRRLAAIGGGS